MNDFCVYLLKILIAALLLIVPILISWYSVLFIRWFFDMSWAIAYGMSVLNGSLIGFFWRPIVAYPLFKDYPFI